MTADTHHATPPSLEQILHRDDIWRGHGGQAVGRRVLDTGFAPLNQVLQGGGWPLGALMEICQRTFQGEWQLFLPALLGLQGGLIALINPPAAPFSQALIQTGIDLDRLLVIDASGKSLFLPSFRELTRSAACAAILGWQPQEGLTYTELRKCLLTAAEGQGLYALMRPASAMAQSSPAPLRLFCQMSQTGLQVTPFKQKGLLQRHQPRPVVLPMPAEWQAVPAHADLGESVHPAPTTIPTAAIRRLRQP